jgi:ribosomal protein L11 methyltransferase
VHQGVFTAPQAIVESLGDTLSDELGALAVSVEDADADQPDEQALYGEPGLPPPRASWARSRLTALFDDEAAARQAAHLVMASGAFDGTELIAIEEVPAQDWVRLTQSQFAPIPVAPGFWIVPSWHERPADAQVVLQLDPGRAFGTGSHPTTRMCLRWLASNAALSNEWTRVLDYGCGSGILAIAAGLLGATGIDAVDIDPAAVAATVHNAERNGVAINAGLPDTAVGTYPLVLANILATPLKLLAPVLGRHVAAPGRLLLAGILERQADELAAAYAPALDLQVIDEEDGWILMTAERVVAASAAAGRIQGFGSGVG